MGGLLLQANGKGEALVNGREKGRGTVLAGHAEVYKGAAREESCQDARRELAAASMLPPQQRMRLPECTRAPLRVFCCSANQTLVRRAPANPLRQQRPAKPYLLRNETSIGCQAITILIL